MEATKAENMITHRDEIYSRCKRTWFATEKDKKLVAKSVKESLERGKGAGNKVISAQQAEDLKMKEKWKREREKNLPRKKRRKLEAAREELEDNNELRYEAKFLYLFLIRHYLERVSFQFVEPIWGRIICYIG